MAEIQLTGSFVSIDDSNVTTSKSSVQQLIDIIQADIASDTGSATRKKYQVFVSGGTNLSSITSSLYQTVFDQDFTLGTSNPLFDITIGSFADFTNANAPVVNQITAETDEAGKLIFEDGSNNNINSIAMMREKVSMYRQFAQNLIGDPDAYFITPHTALVPEAGPDNGTNAKIINGAVFLSFRRLFTRDNIYKGSFGMKIHKEAADLKTGAREQNISVSADSDAGDLHTTYLIDDTKVNTNLTVDTVGGEVTTLQDNNGHFVGLIYYDKGIVVLDVERVFDADQIIRGIIDSVDTSTVSEPAKNADDYGFTHPAFDDQVPRSAGETVFTEKLYPNLWVSGTIDNVVDHICDTRFGTGNLSAIGFRNETIINSSLYFCRAAPSQLNYSTNPTYVDSNGDIIPVSVDTVTRNPFTFVTTVGLYDADGFLLAVAKTSRPIEKNPETDLSIRIRLDY